MTVKNQPVGPPTSEPGASADPAGKRPVEPGVNANGTSGTEDPETFTKEYVVNLREEAAAARIKAKRADDAETRLREVAIASAVSNILMAPDDLVWDESYADENGFPDHDKIIAAAEALIARKPHLGRPRGLVGQGERGDAAPQVSLSGLLRAGA